MTLEPTVAGTDGPRACDDRRQEPRQGSATVVILAYNHAAYVEQALDSAFAQTYPDLRVLIFDDASSDSTAAVVRSYLESTPVDATFVHHEVNLGLCATLNEAVELVDTEFVAFISADDWMEPDRFELQVRELQSLGPTFGMIYGDMRVVDKDGRAEEETFLDKYFRLYAPGHSPPTGDVFLEQLIINAWATPSVLLRRAVFDTVGLYDESLPMEDFDMFLRVSRHFHVGYLKTPLVNYRQTPGSLWSSLDGDVLRIGLAYRQSLLKHLGVSDEADGIIARRIGSYAKAMYVRGRSPGESAGDFVLALQHERRVSTGFYLLAAKCRVPGRALRPGIEAARRVKIRLQSVVKR